MLSAMHVQRCNHSGFKKSCDYTYIFSSTSQKKVNYCRGVNIQNLIDLNNHMVTCTCMSIQVNLKYCGFNVVHQTLFFFNGFLS